MGFANKMAPGVSEGTFRTEHESAGSNMAVKEIWLIFINLNRHQWDQIQIFIQI